MTKINHFSTEVPTICEDCGKCVKMCYFVEMCWPSLNTNAYEKVASSASFCQQLSWEIFVDNRLTQLSVRERLSSRLIDSGSTESFT